MKGLNKLEISNRSTHRGLESAKYSKTVEKICYQIVPALRSYPKLITFTQHTLLLTVQRKLKVIPHSVFKGLLSQLPDQEKNLLLLMETLDGVRLTMIEDNIKDFDEYDCQMQARTDDINERFRAHWKSNYIPDLRQIGDDYLLKNKNTG